jgi:hypothetical protein
MKRRLTAIGILAAALIQCIHAPLVAQTGCEGTSGSAMINSAAWTAQCVIASTSPTCVDSLGNDYECFAIVGSNGSGGYEAVSIFLAQAPQQGNSYPLGGAAGENGALVIGGVGLWVTGDAPYTGTVDVTVYEPANSTIECTFSFKAISIFGQPDLDVTSGTFVGKLVAVQPSTWSAVKQVYR